MTDTSTLESSMAEKREDLVGAVTRKEQKDEVTDKENVSPNDQMEDADVVMEDQECKDVSDGSVDTMDTNGASPMDEDDRDQQMTDQEGTDDLSKTAGEQCDEGTTTTNKDPAKNDKIAEPTKMDTDDEPGKQTPQEPVVGATEGEQQEEEPNDDSYDGPTVDLAALLNVEDLSADQQKLMSSRLGTLQEQYKEDVQRQRELRLQEIKNGYKFNVNVEITDEEASFMYDFCKKHQFDPMDKIEDEGIFFLQSLKEMMEERKKQRAAGFDKDEKKMKKKKRKRRTRNRGTSGNGNGTNAVFSDGSEWEAFSDEEFDDSDDSDYDYDSEPDDLLTDNTADKMDVDGDVDDSWADDAEERKRRRRQRRANAKIQKGQKLNGEKRCGRLLLDDALKVEESKEGWSEARIKAFEQRESNPNSYYYRFNDPGEKQGHGDWSSKEKKLFMERLLEKGANVQWGVFSMKIPGRVGYQCSNYYRQLILNGDIIDPNYTYDQGNRKLNFRRGKLKGKDGKVYSSALNDAYKQYAFLVKKDGTGVWTNLPARHPKCPKIVLKDEDGEDDQDDAKDVEEENETDNGTSGKKKRKKVAKKSSSTATGKKKGKKRRKKSDDDEQRADEAEAPARKRRRTEKSNGGKRKKKTDDPDFTATVSTAEVDANNPLPELIDMITNLPVVQPAISPFGHVLGYETWTRILRQGHKNTCPFTKQKLTRRQLTKLTRENIDEFKDRIVNLTADELSGLSISS